MALAPAPTRGLRSARDRAISRDHVGPVTRALAAMLTGLPMPNPAPVRDTVGPVTDAIRTMRAADPAFDRHPELRALRSALADRIEADIAVYDALGGNPDAEPKEPDHPAAEWSGYGAHRFNGGAFA